MPQPRTYSLSTGRRTGLKSIAAADISALKDAGISEDDIVRLSELTAFVNYQARVSRGLRLLAGLS